MAKRTARTDRTDARSPVRIPVRRSRRSGPTHGFQDDQRGPRIQKVLADAGINSRRACESLVAEGLVTVNGQVIDGLPAWVNPERDDIRVEGQRLKRPERHVYVMLFKPKSVLSVNSDPEGRKLANDLVDHPSKARLFPVGRLDIDSSGLLLLTNDGELTNRLTHPRFEMAKGYEVTVGGRVTDESLRELERAVFPARGADAHAASAPRQQLSIMTRDAGKSIIYMEVREGRTEPIRRTLARLGHPVKKLRRVRIGPLQLKGLQIGEWRDLTAPELSALREYAFATPQERAARKSAQTAGTGAARNATRSAGRGSGRSAARGSGRSQGRGAPRGGPTARS